ncbi:MAG: hypothetical protein AAF629_12380 [Chloroflexota bacterium]
MTNRQPLTLPDNFNPETSLLSNTTEYGTFHESRKGARLAHDLVANGTPQDLALAEKVLTATLNCQELRDGDPHFGNFLWMAEDDVVFDLNAVEFCLEHLIPMMIKYADRLSAEMQEQILTAIRLGLEEIRRLDVLVAYSNITVLDILNTCLGGELLANPQIAQRGYMKLVQWIAFTDQAGVPFEYNSPTYTAVTLRALKYLIDLAQDEPTRIRAKTVVARLGLSVALHIHAKTGRWAGPHSRAYHPSVVGDAGPEIEMIEGWIKDGILPLWVSDVLHHRPEQLFVTETANVDRQYGLSTYHTESYALGVASNGFGGQANVFLGHYHRPQTDNAGVIFTRYILNEKWLGDSYHATDRTKSRNLIDEGRFFGVQDKERAIGVYAPQTLGLCSGAKGCIVWTQQDLIDEIWIGDNQVDALPASVPKDAIIVIASGDVLTAIRPLSQTDLGRNAPIQLVERNGDLVLEIYNYLGPEKQFWEMNWPGAFYKGQPQCGFYAEFAERVDYANAQAFGAVVARGEFLDQAEAPFVYAGEGTRLWQVTYQRDDREIGIEVDLMAWQLHRRWTNEGELSWPMLASSVAKQSRDGQVTMADAKLECGPEAGWLYANPQTRVYVAGYQGLAPTTLRLTLPNDSIELENVVCGTLVWDNGKVTIDILKSEP